MAKGAVDQDDRVMAFFAVSYQCFPVRYGKTNKLLSLNLSKFCFLLSR